MTDECRRKRRLLWHVRWPRRAKPNVGQAIVTQAIKQDVGRSSPAYDPVEEEGLPPESYWRIFTLLPSASIGMAIRESIGSILPYARTAPTGDPAGVATLIDVARHFAVV